MNKKIYALLLCMILLLSSFTPVSAASNTTLNKTNLTLNAKKSYTLKLLNNTGKVKWSSSKNSVATVNSKGKVTAKKKGTAVITATVGKAKYKCKVTVNQFVTSVKLNKKSINLKGASKTYKLKTTIKPSGASKKVSWKSSNTEVATVDASGKVKTIGNGTCKITATATDGSKKSASCTVKVSGIKTLAKPTASDNVKPVTPAKPSTPTPADPVKPSTPSTPSTPAKPSTPSTPSTPAHVHSYSPATCTKPATCSCGATKGAALGHDFGNNNKTCSRCGATNPNYTEIHVHKYTETVLEPPTCASTGLKVCKCSCGYEEYLTIPATGNHNYAPATCGKPETCTVCGATRGSATGAHNYAPATCTKPATCTICGATKGATLCHDYVETFNSRPTTHEVGMIAYKCSVCGNENIVTIPKLTTPDISEEEVYARLMKCREQYPDGTPWGMDKSYVSKYCASYGIACEAFALMISDMVFENRGMCYNGYPQTNINVNDIKSGKIPLRVGDIIITPHHASVVLKVEGNNIITADGNAGGEVLWFNYGMTIDDIQSVWTRY